MEVFSLVLVFIDICSSKKLMEPLNPWDLQDGDTTVAAEGLQQGEVDLQRHILFMVGCKDAQNHTVWIPKEKKKKKLAFTCLGYGAI